MVECMMPSTTLPFHCLSAGCRITDLTTYGAGWCMTPAAHLSAGCRITDLTTYGAGRCMTPAAHGAPSWRSGQSDPEAASTLSESTPQLSNR